MHTQFSMYLHAVMLLRTAAVTREHRDAVDRKDCTHINIELVIIELLNPLDFPAVTTYI